MRFQSCPQEGRHHTDLQPTTGPGDTRPALGGLAAGGGDRPAEKRLEKVIHAKLQWEEGRRETQGGFIQERKKPQAGSGQTR